MKICPLNYLTGYAPIRDHTGEVVAFVGIDVRATRLDKIKRDVAIVAILRQRLGLPTYLENDANAGALGEDELARLRSVAPSQGMMIESLRDDLDCHRGAPDKTPARRLATLEAAGRLQIPFTTGILIGIGETHAERVESLLAIRALHERYGHIQEVIIQNFRAKPTIPMRDWPDPVPEDLLRTVAVARLLLGPDMNIQAPPNLSAQGYDRLPAAGLNDWGGISPLTPDHINPERPWPGLAELRRRTESAGHELRERLAVYPEYATRAAFLDERLRDRVSRAVDPDGLVRPDLEVWRRW